MTVHDHEAAQARADRVFVTAHPAEPATSVVLRAGEAALRSYLDDVLGSGRPDEPDGIDAEPLRRLLARHLHERLPEGRDAELHAAVTAAAVVAALDLALTDWLTAGAHPEAAAACRERFRAVAPLLPPEPTPPDPRERRHSAADTAPGRPSRRSPLA